MDGLSPEKKAALQRLLAELPPAAQAKLIEVFERERLVPDATGAADGVLSTLRDAGAKASPLAKRPTSPERAFFEPIDTLFETAVDGKLLPGSFDRAHIRPIWNWLRRNIAPEVVQQAEADISQEALRGNTVAVNLAAETLRDFGVTALSRLYDPENRVIAQDEGLTDSELQSAIRLGDVLLAERQARTALQTLAYSSNDLTEAQAASIHNAYRPLTERRDNSSTALLILVMTRLRRPWQIFRLVRRIHPAGNDKVLDLTDFAVFGTRILDHLERVSQPLLAAGRDGAAIDATAMITAVEAYNAFVSGFMREFDAERDGPWGRRLSEIRRNVANALEAVADRASALMDDALPVVRARIKNVGVIDHAKLTAKVSEADVRNCAEHVRFVQATRLTAAAAGFGAAREKALKEIGLHLGKFQDGVLEQMGNPQTRALAQSWVPWIQIVTEALEGKDAAAIFQRRAKAA